MRRESNFDTPVVSLQSVEHLCPGAQNQDGHTDAIKGYYELLLTAAKMGLSGHRKRD